MNSLDEIINHIQDAVFSYDMKKFQEGISDFTSNIGSLLSDKNNNQRVVETLKNINTAIENHDYMMVSDLLQFSIKPMIK